MRAIAASVGLVLAAAMAAAADGPTFWAQATFVRGEVTAAEPGAPAPVPVQRGDTFERGVVVRCGSGSRATFLLSDGSLLAVPPDSEHALEPRTGQGRPSLAEVAHNLTRTVAERASGDPLLKHVGGLRDDRENLAVAPRRTRVRFAAVRLLWAVSPPVTRYRVRVLGPSGTIASREVGEPWLEIPAELLEVGAGYIWEVRDAADPDALLPLASASFGVLDGETAHRLAAQEGEIEALRATETGDDTSADYLGYLACREAELYLEATLRLDRLLAAEPGDPGLSVELGRLRELLELDDARLQRLRQPTGP